MPVRAHGLVENGKNALEVEDEAVRISENVALVLYDASKLVSLVIGFTLVMLTAAVDDG